MLAAFGGLAMKAIILLLALFTLGGTAGLHRMSLAVTMLVVFITTTAAEAWAGQKLQILIGTDPGSTDA